MRKTLFVFISIGFVLILVLGLVAFLLSDEPAPARTSGPVTIQKQAGFETSNPPEPKRHQRIADTVNSTNLSSNHHAIGSAIIDSQSMPFGYISKYGDLPPSLQGIDMSGTLQADDDGFLIVTKDIYAVFEFFMAGGSEESRQIVINRIREYIAHTLPQKAAAEAGKILNSYIEYKDYLADQQTYQQAADLSDITAKQEKIDRVKQVMQFRKDARRTFMAPDVVDAFYTDEEAYDDYSIGMMELSLVIGLSPEAREQRLISLEALLPEPEKSRKMKKRHQQNIKIQILALKKQGGNEEMIYQLRTEAFGEAAARRLAELDEKECRPIA